MENKHWICLCISYTIELYFYYQFNSIEKGSLYPMALFQIQNLRSNEVHRKVSVNVLLPVDSHAQHPAGERFRTLYLFHGVTDNNMAWLLKCIEIGRAAGITTPEPGTPAVPMEARVAVSTMVIIWSRVRSTP